MTAFLVYNLPPMSLEENCLTDVQRQIVKSYEVRNKLCHPGFWRMRAEILKPSMPRRVRKILAKHSYESPEEVRILDLGCGMGYKNDLIIRSVVTDSVKKIHITGCDLVEPPYFLLSNDNRVSGEFVNLPAEQILKEFGPNSFDVVTGIAVHHHINNLVEVSEQVNAVLKLGGIHLIADNFCWDGNPITQFASKSWMSIYRQFEGRGGYFNGCSADDALFAQQQGGLDILGTFYAPFFVEGIVGRKRLN